MADFDVTLGSNKGNLNVEFDKPTQDLTLKNRRIPTQISETSTMLIATRLRLVLLLRMARSILVYNANTKLFQLRSGNIRLRNNPSLYSGLKYTVEGALIPDTNNAYDLGAPEEDLELSIYLDKRLS